MRIFNNDDTTQTSQYIQHDWPQMMRYTTGTIIVMNTWMNIYVYDAVQVYSGVNLKCLIKHVLII